MDRVGRTSVFWIVDRCIEGARHYARPDQALNPSCIIAKHIRENRTGIFAQKRRRLGDMVLLRHQTMRRADQRDRAERWVI